LQYLNIRKGKRQVRADGTAYAVPLFVKKTRKYGSIIDQTAVTRKKPILVTGAHDSGKSRWLTRLYEEAEPIWGAKIKAEPLWLGALSPLAAWCDSECVRQWWDDCRKQEEAALKAQGTTTIVSSNGKPKQGGKSKTTGSAKSKTRSTSLTGNPKEPRPPWSKLKQWERTEVLPDYCRETNAVLFIDDAHKLTGRKLEIARLCVLSSKIHVVAASEEQRIPPNLRAVLMRRDPQVFRLDSEVAYDATSLLMWLFIAVSMGAGFWEVSLILGGLKALGNGRRSSLQD
jgi:hypothetical protein